jgi:hypothetical protein
MDLADKVSVTFFKQISLDLGRHYPDRNSDGLLGASVLILANQNFRMCLSSSRRVVHWISFQYTLKVGCLPRHGLVLGRKLVIKKLLKFFRSLGFQFY